MDRLDVDGPQPELLGQPQAVGVHVRDGDGIGTEGTGGLPGDQPDRTRTGHEDGAAWGQLGAPAGPDTDGQRLEQAGGVVTDGVGNGVDERGGHGHELTEGSVVRRRGEEANVRAQVVATGETLHAVAAGHARLDGHSLAHLERRHLAPDGGDHPAGLVAQDQGCVHDVRPDPPVLVVVDVGAAYAHRADLDQDLVRRGSRNGPLLDVDLADPSQHADLHRRHGVLLHHLSDSTRTIAQMILLMSSVLM